MYVKLIIVCKKGHFIQNSRQFILRYFKIRKMLREAVNTNYS